MTRLTLLVKWAACGMLLWARPGLTLRSDLRSNQEKRISKVVAVEVPQQLSPPGDSGLENFEVYGINESDWKIGMRQKAPSPTRDSGSQDFEIYGINGSEWPPNSFKEKTGIQVDTVLVSDLSKANFKENRAEWKVESDGMPTPSVKAFKLQSGVAPQSQAQESVPLLHRWRTADVQPRDVQVAMAVALVLTLLVALAMYLYRTYGGTWGTRYEDLNKSADIYIEPEPQAQDAEAAKFHAKIQARLDRFDERLMRVSKDLRQDSASETSSTASSETSPGYTRQPWAAGRK